MSFDEISYDRRVIQLSLVDAPQLPCSTRGPPHADAHSQVIVIKIIVVLLYTFDPHEARVQTVTYGCALAGLIVVAICASSAEQIGFKVAGERLTCKLRSQAMHALVIKDIEFYDDDANSAGALAEFLAAKVRRARAIAQPLAATLERRTIWLTRFKWRRRHHLPLLGFIDSTSRKI